MGSQNAAHQQREVHAVHAFRAGRYSPLRSVDLSDSRITTIAAAHNVSAAQVCLRWVTQLNVLVATSPGSNELYAKQDLQMFSFLLSSAEMAVLSSIQIQPAA